MSTAGSSHDHDRGHRREHAPSPSPGRAHGHVTGHAHGHAHGSPGADGTPLSALATALGITAVVFLAELIGGILSGSMALLADAMHMLSDAAGLIIAVVAVITGRRAASRRATFGYRRVEVLAALANAATVMFISIFIVVEAVRRLREPAEISAGPMMAIAAVGLVANAASAWVLGRHRTQSVNVQGAYLHVMVDLLGSVAVIVAALVIRFTGLEEADVIASLLIAALVLPRAWQLLRDSALVLLEQVPAGFDIDAVEPALRAVDGVADVHDLHLWSLDGLSVLATAHLVLQGEADQGQVLDRAQQSLASLGIDHSTIQLERPEHEGHESIC